MSSSPDKQVLFLTSTNLSSNPRCLKEVRLLYNKGVNITVVGFDLGNWTTEKEAVLKDELKNIRFVYLETSRKNLLPWIFSSLLERWSRLAISIGASGNFISAMAVGKRSWILEQWTKNTSIKPDLIIAHNPPAFYAAYKFAEGLNIPFALDIEDYHPGEGNSKAEKLAVRFLMRKLLNKAAYVSFASPLIKKYTEALLNETNEQGFITVNNSFAVSDFIEPVMPTGDKIKMVWFSQFIDYGRGLEKILPVLDAFSERITLTLIGNMRDHFYDHEIKKRSYIICKPALSQKKLNQDLANYDIGLALEDKTVDMNRNLCLTNKLWSYFQAGLYILASDTDAQKLFIGEHPEHGIYASLENTALADVVKGLLETLPQINSNKINRFRRATTCSWEKESLSLINKWQEILSLH